MGRYSPTVLPQPVNPLARALEQAVEASGRAGDRIPLAVVKKNGAGSRPPMELAVLELDTFLELVGASRDHREPK